MYSLESHARGAGSPHVIGFHDKPTGSCQYIVADPASRKAALIDVVQDFDPRSGATRTDAAQWALDMVRDRGWTVEWVLDTHPHADHLMASSWLKARTGAPNAIGAKTRRIAQLWADFYNLPDAFDPDRDFDRLFADRETFRLGGIDVEVRLHTGHTLGSITYVIGDAAFVHDTFMQPDAGTSRADFPGGSAAELFDSLTDIMTLPDDTRLFVGHDYGTRDRKDPQWESTVAQQRRSNTHLGRGTTRDAFIALREARDATLPLPDRILHALQVNLRAGRLPDPEADGFSYFKIPANRFTGHFKTEDEG